MACARPTHGLLLLLLLSELLGSGTDDCDASATNVSQTWYIDTDADGYGSSTTVSCTRPTNGFLITELSGTGTDDCDDSDAIATNAIQIWFIDADGDRYGVSSMVSCERPTHGYNLSELSGTGVDDCDDSNSTINPNTVWYSENDNSYSTGCFSPGSGYETTFYINTNGVTCMCPNANIGDTGIVNGIAYTKRAVDDITTANAANTCTSGITVLSHLM